MKIRALIIDDEALARDRLKRLLATEENVELIGEAADGKSALELIRQLKPELIFLDVQIPELDGFGVLESLPEKELPAVIFVTAHDKFALKAFDVEAVDYLLKPFDRARLSTAVGRASEKLAKRTGEPVQSPVASEKSIDRIAVKRDGRVLLIKVEDVDWIESADNYVSLHVGKETHLLRETMNSIEAKLPREKFLRISRMSIVNLSRIKEMQPMFHGEYIVQLNDGSKLTLTRGYRDKLKQLLGKAE